MYYTLPSTNPSEERSHLFCVAIAVSLLISASYLQYVQKYVSPADMCTDTHLAHCHGNWMDIRLVLCCNLNNLFYPSCL